MREDLLHFIWKFRKLQLKVLSTSNKERLSIVDYGIHNLSSGPDFFNARVIIGGQLWAGNVEMHVKASDWYVHHHEKDPNYQNVILHVVWENDIPIFRSDNSEIATLVLRDFISQEVLANYHQLFNHKHTNFINCEKQIREIDSFIIDHWLERLYFERLERKSEEINLLLKQSGNSWERVLFLILLKYFGLNKNKEAFLSLGTSIAYSVTQKTRKNPPQLESILFGMAGLLDAKDHVDNYFIALKSEYEYLKKKFKLESFSVIKPDFFGIRPSNFPTIRLSQFAALYEKPHLFSSIIEASTAADFSKLFKVTAHHYWHNHFVFGKQVRGRPKIINKRFINLLLINAIIPLKFCYARFLGIPMNEKIISLLSEIKAENNGVLQQFKQFGIQGKNAFEGQALLQLYNEYCVNNKCLRCAVGTKLLNGK